MTHKEMHSYFAHPKLTATVSQPDTKGLAFIKTLFVSSPKGLPINTVE